MDRNCMETQYWDMMVDIRYQVGYCEKYEHRTKIIDGFLTGCVAVVSSASIASWAIWGTVPVLWAVLIAIGQVLQILKPLLPYSQRMIALRFYNPALKAFSVNTEHRWNRRTLLGDEAFSDALRDDKNDFVAIECRFIGSNTIPTVKKLSIKAMKEAKQYMASFGACIEGDDTNA